MYKEILFGSSILLGIFIILNQFILHTPSVFSTDASYHVGCYDSTITHHHSVAIHQKLKQLALKKQQNIKLNMHDSIALSPNFEKKVQEVALSFDSFLDEYYRLKIQNEQDLQYYNSLKLAKMDYEKCLEDLTLDSDACHKAWDQYREVSVQFQTLKNQLSELIQQKQKQQNRIAAMILEHQDLDEDQIETLHIEEMTTLQKQLQQKQQQIINQQTQKNKITLDIEEINAKLTELTGLRSKCPQNSNLIKFCRDINARVNFLGKEISDNKAGLQKRIGIKKKIMATLELGMKKLKKYGTQDQVSHQQKLQQQHKRELQLLIAEVDNFETIEESICKLCAQEQIQKLDQQILQLKKTKLTLEQQLKTIEGDIQLLQGEKKNLQNKIRDAQNQFQAKINSMFCIDEACKQGQAQTYKQFERILSELKKDIIDKQVQINFLKSKNEKQIKTLTTFLEEINAANSCMRKKEYYHGLKKHSPSEAKSEDKMLIARDEMMKDLTNLEL